MHLSEIVQAFRNTASRYPLELERAKARQPALARHKDGLAVLAAIRRPADDEQRSELVRALLDENRSHPHAVWQAMLIVAFGPTLVALRRKASVKPNEDLDQEVLVAFFDALTRMPAAKDLEWPIFSVRRATARPFYRASASARLLPKRLFSQYDTDDLDDDADPKHELVADPSGDPSTIYDARVLHAWVERFAEGDAEFADMLVATADGAKTLREFVAATHADDPPHVRDAAYQRLRRKRLQLAARIEALPS